MRRIHRGIDELRRIFDRTPDKHAAHRASRPVLEDLAGAPGLLPAMLDEYLRSDDPLGRLHYPVVAIELDLNPHFSLTANCWLPLPDRSTDLSTKSVHHHGPLLLSSVTVFGPGYEHWMFSAPAAVDPARELFSMKLLERAPHPTNHVAFVPEQLAHLPMYPPDLTITLALFSNSVPTTFLDRLKRVRLLKRNEAFLRRLAERAGLDKALDLKKAVYYDFYPVPEGFRGMLQRQEFERGPNEHYLQSLAYILQRTGNDRLSSTVRAEADAAPGGARRDLLRRLVEDLRSGRAIEPRLSPCHTGVPHANFTRADLERALAAVGPAQPGARPDAV
ncbi:MAG TPA: hypothetical protein VG389_03080 [Myxococcota bacterium]|jgi:hypothetical protein|nr:hypothetical protein [Myxococcota bacterium]